MQVCYSGRRMNKVEIVRSHAKQENYPSGVKLYLLSFITSNCGLVGNTLVTLVQTQV